MVMVLYPPVGSNPKFGAQVVTISKKYHCILEHGNEVPTSQKKQWFTLKNTNMSAACTGAHQSNFQSPQNASTEELLTLSSLLHFIVEGNDTLSVNDDKQNRNYSSARHVAGWSADGGDDDVSQSTDCTACTLSDDCRFWLFCHLVLSCNLWLSACHFAYRLIHVCECVCVCGSGCLVDSLLWLLTCLYRNCQRHIASKRKENKTKQKNAFCTQTQGENHSFKTIFDTHTHTHTLQIQQRFTYRSKKDMFEWISHAHL